MLDSLHKPICGYSRIIPSHPRGAAKARWRADSHDIRCPGCGSDRMPRNGTAKGRQIYRCGDCGRYYTHGDAYTRPGPPAGNRRWRTAREVVYQSAVARSIGVTPPTVSQWGKKKGCHILSAVPPGTVAAGSHRGSTASGDCLCCNVDLSAGATWGQAAVLADLDGGSAGNRWPSPDGLEIGDRSEASLQRRYARLSEAELYHSDAYAVYGRLPLGQQVKGKGGAVNRTRILHS